MAANRNRVRPRAGIALVIAWAIAVCAIFALFAPGQTRAATPFGMNGTAIPPIYLPGGFSAPVATLRQTDGKVVIAGTADGSLARTLFAARFTASGALDTTHGNAGRSARIDALDAAIDSAGNVVIVGDGITTPPGFNYRVVVARVLPSGAPDAAFGTNGIARVLIPTYDTQTTFSGIA